MVWQLQGEWWSYVPQLAVLPQRPAAGKLLAMLHTASPAASRGGTIQAMGRAEQLAAHKLRWDQAQEERASHVNIHRCSSTNPEVSPAQTRSLSRKVQAGWPGVRAVMLKFCLVNREAQLIISA